MKKKGITQGLKNSKGRKIIKKELIIRLLKERIGGKVKQKVIRYLETVDNILTTYQKLDKLKNR